MRGVKEEVVGLRTTGGGGEGKRVMIGIGKGGGGDGEKVTMMGTGEGVTGGEGEEQRSIMMAEDNWDVLSVGIEELEGNGGDWIRRSLELRVL